MATNEPPPPAPPSGGNAPPRAHDEPPPPRRISSAQVFRGATEVQIDHHGVLYRLRQTALGKLILTK